SRRLATMQQGETEAALIWRQLEEEARARRFIVQRTPTGIVTGPLSPLDKPYTPDQYAVLPESEKERLNQVRRELQGRINEALRRVRQVERATREKLRELERETAHYATDHLFQAMKERYQHYPDVLKYLDNVQADIVNNVALIRTDGVDPEELHPLQALFRGQQRDLYT